MTLASRLSFEAYRGDGDYLFASYAHSDSRQVYRELRRLNQEGFNVWYDEGIKPSIRWTEELATAIEKSAVFVAFITPAFVASENCVNEIEFALSRRRRVLAVHLEPTELPPGLELNLGNKQAILKDRYEPEIYERKLREALESMLRGESVSDVYPERAPRRRPPAWLIGAVVALAGALIYHFAPSPMSTRMPAAKPSIAVLPFVNVSETADNEFFSDGLTEETISLLADVVELRVAARTSSFYYKDRQYNIPDVAQRLAVDVILEGSVRRQADQVRVTAQLVDAASETILWTEIYDRRLQDIFAIQSDIARQVTSALEVILSARSEVRLSRSYTSDLQAYDSYLLGRNALRQPRTEDTLGSAVERFQQAIDLDAGFAQAYAGLCEARLGQYELARAASFFKQAEAACLRALTRDSEATDTYLALAILHFFAGMHEQAEGEFKQVIGLNPSLVDARIGLARNYAAAGRTEEAEAAFRQAIEQDPGFWRGYQLLGNFLYESGRYDEAASNYREVIERTPDNAHAWSNLGAAEYMIGDFAGAAEAYRQSLRVSPTRAAYSNTGTMYYFAGDFDSAARMYRKALELTPENPSLWGNLGDALKAGAGPPADAVAAYRRARDLSKALLDVNPDDAENLAESAYFSARLGDADRALQTLSRAVSQGPDNMWSYYYGALIYADLGRNDEALDSLRKAVELGYQPILLKADPSLARLAADERFLALVDGSGEKVMN